MTNDNNWDGSTDRRSGIERREEGGWYGIQQGLFDRIDHMSDKFSDKVDKIETKLGDKIENLQGEIRKYNNLNGKIEVASNTATKINETVQQLSTDLGDQVARCNKVQNVKKGQKDIYEFIKTGTPWIIIVTYFIFYMIDRFGG